MQSEHKCYLGYYHQKHKLLAISSNKELLINYLTNHRGLKSYEYVIEKDYISDTDLLLKYDNFIITEYNGYCIPNIDQNIIELHSHSIDQELIATIEQLKHIALLSTNVKKISEEDVRQMISTIKILSNIKSKPKVLNKLNKQNQINHSILYCDIEEYLLQLRQYNELCEYNSRYNNALVEF